MAFSKTPERVVALQNSPDTKFLDVAVSLNPQRVLVVLFRSLSVFGL
jgi:hypothetical protein